MAATLEVSASALDCWGGCLQGATGGGGFNDDMGVALARRGSDTLTPSRTTLTHVYGVF